MMEWNNSSESLPEKNNSKQFIAVIDGDYYIGTWNNVLSRYEFGNSIGFTYVTTENFNRIISKWNYLD